MTVGRRVISGVRGRFWLATTVRYAALLTFLAWIGRYLYRTDVFGRVPVPTPTQGAVSCVIALVIFSLSGLQISETLYSLRGFRLKPVDLVRLPVTMNFWGYLVPLKGGFLYSLVFLRSRYGLTTTGGFSLSVYMYAITLALGGIIGLAVWWQHDLPGAVAWTSVVLALAPLGLVVIPAIHHPRLDQFVGQVRLLSRSPSLAGKLAALNIAHTAGQAAWFYYLGNVLGVELSVSAALLMSVMTKIALVIRLTPGNVGVDQLLAGAVTTSLGYEASTGMLISLFALATCLILSVPIGAVSSIQLARSGKLPDLLGPREQPAEDLS